MRGYLFIALSAMSAWVLVGCSSKEMALSAAEYAENAAKISKAPADSSFLVGKWKGELKMSEASKDDAGAALAKGMGDMLVSSMSLEFLPDSKFRLTAMGCPMEGPFTMEGNKLRLTPDKVMGMTIDEFQKMAGTKSEGGFSKEEFTKPLVLTISMDGMELTAEPEDGEEGSGTLVFRRDASTYKKERLTEHSTSSEPSSADDTSSLDASIAGSYVADLRVDESKLSEKEKSDLPMAKAMLGSARLDISADGTFNMTLVVDASGTWKQEGKNIVLTITTAMGTKTTSSTEPMMLEVIGDGRTLKAIKNAAATGPSSAMDDALYFVKK